MPQKIEMRDNPHVLWNDEDIENAYTDEEREAINIAILAAGGVTQYIAQRAEKVAAQLGVTGLSVSVGEEEVYRGSGATTPVVLSQGDQVLTQFDVNTLKGGVYMEILVGCGFVPDAAIEWALRQSLELGE